ncbi:YcfL family protein [Comamonas sp. NLF-1-9]|uniref:YcfL family protein n=1 Tax=Comamonas sp. NLF-1-9 TaxID=2853163 RepID=UPI001C48A96E|nr:YcfL family protein [Comamonas sp. NLF-1-9]QXL83861.1 YcfL family protein [Comamonas sp. NLF-1-9]
MRFRTVLGAVVVGASTMGLPALAQHDPATPPAVAAKMALRGPAQGIAVTEMRLVRRNDVLTVQADLTNMEQPDRTVFYRFKWLDSVGNQVGDGEVWKQIRVLGLAQQTVKSVAPHAMAVDLRLEMNVESR